ncbi:hypothetical protein AALA83_06545 [Oscillospiraceae bacterium 44-5]|jgi:hypothetical protein|uniref:hypothetical protein n=1 Tax=Lawsonibacter sp. JLR.KK007 TaxID=3114293 RepID=UPI002173FED4|nr:hypothetical protein [Lawsonibacter sp.]MCI9268960.1 hypothetical protein [Lawsonibacter sp.]
MATEVQKFTQAAGYKPLEDRCIIVKYAPENLSEQITAFFNSEFYVLQMCEHEIILLPFNTTWGNLRKDVSLVLPYGDIQWVELKDDMLNTVITIRTESDTIRLTTQQAELSDLRSSGIYASIYSGFFKNWHKENLDGTLKALTELGNN